MGTEVLDRPERSRPGDYQVFFTAIVPEVVAQFAEVAQVRKTCIYGQKRPNQLSPRCSQKIAEVAQVPIYSVELR